jgi:hypothetical protein
MPLQIAGRDAEAFAFDFRWASAGTGENRTALAHIPNATVATTIEAEAIEPEAPLETQPQRVNPKRR